MIPAVEFNKREGGIPIRKLLPITTVALMCTTGLALAVDNPSGRPGQVLNESKCQQAWKAAGPDGDNLSENAAKPYILNFAAVDTSNDRKISADEWKAGCNKGWVSAARGATSQPDADDSSKSKNSY